jgi:adenylylsulfate kinase-like enzyme
MNLTPEEQKIKNEAIAFAKKNKTRIARAETDKTIYIPDANPVSVFMAGSPGAGKTEIAKSLITGLADKGDKVLRLDVDIMREKFASYNGGNSHLVQAGANILVEKIHDLALKNDQSFIFDGTFSHYYKAKQNIERSLSKDRTVLIIYTYLDPAQAWGFVKAREEVEGRRIIPELFVDQYFNAREVVNRLKTEFQGDIMVDLLVKNLDGGAPFYKNNIDVIDNHLPEKYDRASVLSITTN